MTDADGGVRVATALSASRSSGDFTYFDPIASGEAGHDVNATQSNAGHAAVNGLVSVALPVRFGSAEAGALTVTTLAQARRQGLPGTCAGSDAVRAPRVGPRDRRGGADRARGRRELGPARVGPA